MTERLRVSITLSEDLSLIPRIHTELCHNCPQLHSSKESDALLKLQWTPVQTWYAHREICTYT